MLAELLIAMTCLLSQLQIVDQRLFSTVSQCPQCPQCPQCSVEHEEKVLLIGQTMLGRVSSAQCVTSHQHTTNFQQRNNKLGEYQLTSFSVLHTRLKT